MNQDIVHVYVGGSAGYDQFIRAEVVTHNGCTYVVRWLGFVGTWESVRPTRDENGRVCHGSWFGMFKEGGEHSYHNSQIYETCPSIWAEDPRLKDLIDISEPGWTPEQLKSFNDHNDRFKNAVQRSVEVLQDESVGYETRLYRVCEIADVVMNPRE